MSESEMKKEGGESFKPDSASEYIRFRGLTIEPGHPIPYAAITIGEVAEICRVTGWYASFDGDTETLTFEEMKA